MSVITLPANLPVTMQPWEQVRNDMEFRSILGSQAVEATAPLWAMSISAPSMNDSDANVGAWQAMLLKLCGKTNQLAAYNFGRPQPRGTMRGTMTLNGAHAQGAAVLNIVAAGENSKTLIPGDFIGLGSGTTQQVVMVVTGGTSNGSGQISVTVEPPLRNAFSNGAAVTWDKPCALFRARSAPGKWSYRPGILVEGMGVDLIEDWRA